MAQVLRFGRYGPPWLDVRLEKVGRRRRRYWIRRAKQRDTWYAQIFFGEAQHRGATVDGVVAAQRFFGEFVREIGELQKDGWRAARVWPPEASSFLKFVQNATGCGESREARDVRERNETQDLPEL